ncbi:2-octaprenyl-6-methoxyphenyl hydroxylase [Glaesserella parasuis]|uniref:2-octaprenyl-6-methoxyphenyl hydroxylase n=2 Tax=Glaesserella parasuis TaxID=738 RepID=A0A836MFN7_GLAPU|nr:2-octaprenyl-6-methoxyphenyl hydroxylase [Glaesserella parasuis]KDB48778.1 2-octaprenyl-6-methoxyphenyl hydroxylase [Glaesserella parasuis HPS10]MCT8581331.1 2-octaprenyl-6-methoxyphenyl hydroxylase [Glaesserella parasuis]MCT8585329.1 2-octaprenyl-6-methoxyphenyl hydroxylase [Glaesserella parasuis]MCT8627844.1 2-octaprenyl-6-methoxyphenyl hydroxylase [Glaesserella parasuis]MCT8675982.1 2-octaprenyl-6-methoxyphenyl hydroxylase [Glaesserella parasuis]
MKQNIDVVIVGGAVTGSVLALALSSVSGHQLQIAIVEKNEPNYAQQGGFDARSIAFAYGSLQKLAQIRPLATEQNLAQLVYRIATPIKQIHVSDQGHFGKTTLKADELRLSELGVVVELTKLGEQLTALIAKQPNIQLFCPDTVAHIERTEQHCHITLNSGTQLTSKLLVACDGIQSQIAQQCGVTTQFIKDYQQSAIIANVILSEPHQNHAFERFTKQGPFALLPLNEKMMSLVWCMEDPTDAMAMSDSDFLHALQQQFGWKLGKFLQVSKRFVYPLSSQKSENHIHHRLAIVGNASQLLHPVAGQGFNLGMRDLFELATLVGQAFAQGEDFGEAKWLQQFEQHRQADQTRIMQSTSGLISIFGCEFLPIQVARNLALFGLSHFSLVRNAVAHKALGW